MFAVILLFSMNFVNTISTKDDYCWFGNTYWDKFTHTEFHHEFITHLKKDCELYSESWWIFPHQVSPWIASQSKYFEYVNQIISSFRVASKDEHFHLHTANTTPTRSNGISASVIFSAIFSPPHTDQYWIIGGKFAVGARVDVVRLLIPFSSNGSGWKVWKLIPQWSHNYVRSFLVQQHPVFLLYLLTGGLFAGFFVSIRNPEPKLDQPNECSHIFQLSPAIFRSCFCLPPWPLLTVTIMMVGSFIFCQFPSKECN